MVSGFKVALMKKCAAVGPVLILFGRQAAKRHDETEREHQRRSRSHVQEQVYTKKTSRKPMVWYSSAEYDLMR